MRNRSSASKLVRTCAYIAAAAAVLVGARADASPQVQTSEGQLVSAYVELFYPGQSSPERGVRVSLVPTGAPTRERRVAVRRVPRWEDEQMFAGRVVGRLKADQTYDVEIRTPGEATIVVPAAFTARAPRITSMGSGAARGETVAATVDFATRSMRFRVNGVAARVTSSNGYDFDFEVPRRLPASVSIGKVTAVDFGVRVAAPHDLVVSPTPHALSATAGGLAYVCTRESWYEQDGAVVVYGLRVGLSASRDAVFNILLKIPSSAASLTAPATFTVADGANVQWGNFAQFGRAFPGPLGFFGADERGFGGATCTITVDAVDGARIRGTFSAHLVDQRYADHEPDGRELDVVDGRFDVDRE